MLKSPKIDIDDFDNVEHASDGKDSNHAHQRRETCAPSAFLFSQAQRSTFVQELSTSSTEPKVSENTLLSRSSELKNDFSRGSVVKRDPPTESSNIFGEPLMHTNCERIRCLVRRIAASTKALYQVRPACSA